jgi:thiol-disulfide isomerase/thioredoxin
MRLILHFVTTILFFLSASCASYTPRKADLVVTYDDKVIKSSGPTWTTQEELVQTVAQNKKVYIVFIATWCEPCKVLVRISKTEGWLGKVHFLNIDEVWVNAIARDMKITGVPSLVVASDRGAVTNKILYGLPQVATYLSVHIE